MITHLDLIPAVRSGVKYSARSYRSERHFLDFAVDGESLWEKLRKPDMVSVLCFEYAAGNPGECVKAVNRLLLTEKADHPEDRRSLFVCSECGDLGCGAISSLMVRAGETVIWKDFGLQNNYDNNVELSSYQGIGPFAFDATAYERALLAALDKLQKSFVR